MKHLKSIAFLLLVTFSMTSCLDFLTETVEGSGNVIKKEDYDVSGFSKIAIATGINAYIKIGDTENIIVEADDNILELIQVKVSGDKLSVYLDKNIKNYKKMDVYITAKELEVVKASSSANVNVEGILSAETLSCDASSAGNIHISANVTNLNCDASSAGQIKIGELTASKSTFSTSSAGGVHIEKGVIKDLIARASSSGSVNAFNVETQSCDADASSGGSINVNVVKTLLAEASSGGNVHFKGNPTVEKMKTSSGGNINKD